MKNDIIEAIKLFREPLASSDMTCYIRGVGIKEIMRPIICDRPKGTGDWLLMYFHDPVLIKSSGGIDKYPAGSFIIWSDTDGHYYGVTDRAWLHSWVHFKGRAIAPMIADAGLKINRVMFLDSPEILLQSLLLIYHEMIGYADPDAVILQNLFQNMLRQLSRQIGFGKNDKTMPLRILKIKNMIESFPANKYTITDLSRQASMSVPHFCAEFKRCVGAAPIEYLIRMRLHQARYLLYDRNQSIAEIADKVGYNDIYHFSKQFKKHFGVSPRKLR